MRKTSTESGKIYAALSYVTIIGWLIVFLLNKSEKNSFTNFHLRQSLGIHIIMLLVSYFQNFKFLFFNIKNLINILGIVFLVLGFYYAITEEKKLIPFFGKTFQNWFKFI